ncbi:hypothetical protein ACB098_02G194400 [Castanea mollissima]
MLKLVSEKGFSKELQDKLLINVLKQKLHTWLLQKAEDGVSVNFRDVNGWTALHWAAFSGRECTVASLVSLGADPGALIDPCSKYPLGRTAAHLASANGHQRIAGHLFRISSDQPPFISYAGHWRRQ